MSLLVVATALLSIFLVACSDETDPTPVTSLVTSTPTIVPTTTLISESTQTRPAPEPTPTSTLTPTATPTLPEPARATVVAVTPDTVELTPTVTRTPQPTPSPTPTPVPTAKPTPPELARGTVVNVTPKTVELTGLGPVAQLRAEIRNQNANVMAGSSVAWVTSDSSVATVDAAGVVTATGNGTATITASAGSASGVVIVTVTQKVTSVEVSPSPAELTAWDETVQLTAEAFDTNGHTIGEAGFTWESGDILVATVTSAGVVTATGNGTAIITASAGAASGAAAVTVTQVVTLVEVSPAAVGPASWGETVQLTARGFDSNGHRVQKTTFTWASTDDGVAAVDADGVVSGIGEGVATITASAGAASGSATVTIPPTFTLSGTVHDSRENGPILGGAVVRLENGKQDSMITGPDGRYRFPNVWGTVKVTAIAVPTHVAETVEISVDEDHRMDFDLEHTGVAPYSGTVYISPRVIEPSDPTMLGTITYAGRGEHSVPDRRHDGRPTINAYLFHVRYGSHVVEFRVNPEFGSQDAARVEVEAYGHVLGQMPAVLLFAITHVVINAGDEPWGGGGKSHGGILVHTDWLTMGSGDEYIEEVMLHEAGHAAWDRSLRDSPEWLAAQEADSVFISRYARDNPGREDVTESFTAYLALRYRPDRLTDSDRAAILAAIPNRLIYFNEQGFDMSPYESSEVR